MSEPVRHDVFVRCPPSHAFRVFTERVDGWWPPSHTRRQGRVLLEGSDVGAELVERSGDERLPIGRVTLWDPPHAVRFDWFLGARPPACTSVTASFEPDGDGTRVRIVHVDGTPGLPDWSGTARIFDRAWGHLLEALATTLHSEKP
ncbi:MAG: SRPBCC domain-containing protein [Alphaproteobacteria bacterium]|nr:SRPBCC domain-containing protein [Alphaproteobacteria bacterium]